MSLRYKTIFGTETMQSSEQGEMWANLALTSLLSTGYSDKNTSVIPCILT